MTVLTPDIKKAAQGLHGHDCMTGNGADLTVGTGPQVAVILPFYQRKAGLLLRAVQSALAQRDCEVQLIVVDDGSPRDPMEDLRELSSLEMRHVQLLRRSNGGPGDARNAGIAAVPPEIRFIAFLDTDDQWAEDHLARAMRAFGAGADFYFTDYVPLGSDKATFELCGLRLADHVQLAPDLFRYEGDLFDALLRRAPVGTSTVVYRREAGSAQRFPTEFSYGEDVIFWMRQTRGSCTVVFSPVREVTYGAGVNVAASARWGNPSSLDKLYSEYRFHLAITKEFPLTPEQKRWSEDYRKGLRNTFLANLIHLSVRFKRFSLRPVLGFAFLLLTT